VGGTELAGMAAFLTRFLASYFFSVWGGAVNRLSSLPTFSFGL
jgi:hypothetical protein